MLPEGRWYPVELRERGVRMFRYHCDEGWLLIKKGATAQHRNLQGVVRGFTRADRVQPLRDCLYSL